MGLCLRRILPRFLSLLLVVTGCGPASSKTNVGTAEEEAKPSLIAEADRHHDFGAVIGRAGQKMDHRYRLENPTGRDVKIVDVINRKTCCGIVHVGRSILRPGEATEVDVTLVVGDKFGEVAHETEVVTDLPSDSNIVLRTTAQAFPAIRVEEVASSEGPILVGTREVRRVELRVLATGTSAEPPVDLDRLELRSTIGVDWAGPKEESPADEGLKVETRRFTASLDPSGLPGDRQAEILLMDGKGVVGRHLVAWVVASAIAATPKMIVMERGKDRYRVTLQSRDQRPFRVVRVDCGVPGVQGRAATGSASRTQIVEVEGVPPPGSGRGQVTVLTDHSAQEKVELPFLVIE